MLIFWLISCLMQMLLDLLVALTLLLSLCFWSLFTVTAVSLSLVRVKPWQLRTASSGTLYSIVSSQEQLDICVWCSRGKNENDDKTTNIRNIGAV